MADKFNTTAGWVLFAGIVALGSSIVSSKLFHADNPEAPEEPGYFIAADEEAGGGGGEMSIEEALNLESVSAAAGEKVFAKCSACHTITPGGANGIGPNLHGVMGKPLAKHAGFDYSSSLAEKGGTWDWATMSDWLKGPRAFASGTKMSFAGLSNIEDRASLMLYMNEQGSNLTVPAFVAEEPAADEGEDGAAEGPGAVEGADSGAVEAAGAMGDDQPVASDNAAIDNN